MADVLNFLVLNWMILNNRLFMWMKMLFLMQITDKKIKITKKNFICMYTIIKLICKQTHFHIKQKKIFSI